MALRAVRKNARGRPRRTAAATVEAEVVEAPDDDVAIEQPVEDEPPRESVSLTALLSTSARWVQFDLYLEGVTPLITHAWSQKARLEMLAKQTKAVRDTLPVRNPEADFVSSLYEMAEGSGQYGFPLGGVKNCILSTAHKDRGVPKTVVRAALHLQASIVRVRPALAGAICDMPLVRIWGGKPEMREDMVRVGAGVRKKATLAYRAQFWPWAIRLHGHVNERMLPREALTFLAREGGLATGIGEWRNERDGIFGSFVLCNQERAAEWDRFARGRGPLPHREPYAGIEFDEAA